MLQHINKKNISRHKYNPETGKFNTDHLPLLFFCPIRENEKTLTGNSVENYD